MHQPSPCGTPCKIFTGALCNVLVNCRDHCPCTLRKPMDPSLLRVALVPVTPVATFVHAPVPKSLLRCTANGPVPPDHCNVSWFPFRATDEIRNAGAAPPVLKLRYGANF